MAQSLKKPENSSAQGNIAANWPLSDFPDPNPYFPPPQHRRGKSFFSPVARGTIAAVATIAACFALALLFGKRLEESMIPMMLVLVPMVFAGFGLVLLAPLLCWESFKSARLWRSGRIIPATVLLPASSPVKNSRHTRWVPVLNATPVALFAQFVAARLDERSHASCSAKVAYVHGGISWTADVPVGQAWSRLKAGDSLWLVLDRKNLPHALATAAPPDQRNTPVPPEVTQWLSGARDRALASFQPPPPFPPFEMESFPHPNPAFPTPPRDLTIKEALWFHFSKWGWTVMVPAGVVLLWLVSRETFAYSTEVKLVIAALTFLLAGPLFLVVGRRHFTNWAFGRIVPALVLKSKPPRAYKWYEKLGTVIVGLLFSVPIPGDETTTPGIYWVRYCIGGDIWEERVAIAKPHDPCSADDVIWVISRKSGGRAQALAQFAPAPFCESRVPPEVSEPARDFLRAHDPNQLKQAAKDNAQAFRRAARYQKRPG